MDLDFTGVKLNLFNITLKDWLFDSMGNCTLLLAVDIIERGVIIGGFHCSFISG